MGSKKSRFLYEISYILDIGNLKSKKQAFSGQN